MTNYYQVLGIGKEASSNDIKKAYRTLAMKWHPDKHGEDNKQQAEQQFKKINEAYRVLSDPEKKNEYDQPTTDVGMFQFNSHDFDPMKFFHQSFDEPLINRRGGFPGSSINFNFMNQMNCSSRSESISIQGHRKIETITETRNGQTKTTVFETDLRNGQRKQIR